MKKLLIIVAIVMVAGVVVSSCNTYKRCPAYSGHVEVESAPITDKT